MKKTKFVYCLYGNGDYENGEDKFLHSIYSTNNKAIKAKRNWRRIFINESGQDVQFFVEKQILL